MAYINPNNNYSCSSWNYGAYAVCNPCYVQQVKTPNPQKQIRYIPPQNNQIYNKYGKRPVREEERIVTNEYLQNINHMKKMEKNKKKEKLEEEEKKRKRKESKIIFKQLKKKKDEELREKKKEKMMQEYETKSKSNILIIIIKGLL